ncbi:MAG: hypothetical protein C4525_06615 [Desulfarculus sp.]|nr:MAG: hypothetical protein C4525_06615 [Desulfarculus sp.]
MAFFLTILFTVIVYVRPQEFWPALQNWPLLDYVGGVAVFFALLERKVTKDKFLRSSANKLVLIFWLWLCFSWLGNGWLGGVWYTIQKFGKVVVLYFLIVMSIDTLSKLRTYIWLLLLLSAFLAVDAIVLFYTGQSITGQVAFARLEGEELIAQARGIGIFADPNDLALYIVPMIAFLLPAFHRQALSRTSLTGVILMIPLITGLVFTRSRGGILAMAIVIWMYLRHRLGMVFSVVGLVLLLGLLMAIPRFESVSATEGTGRTRLDHWAFGLDLLKHNPFFGVGFTAFTDQGYRQTAHNSFILILAEAGVLGGLLWISLFYAMYRDIALLRTPERAPPWLPPLTNALEAGLVGWLAGGFFLSQTYGFLGFMLMGMVVATMNILAGEGIDLRETWTRVQVRNSFLITIGGIIFMHLLVMILWRLGG